MTRTGHTRQLTLSQWRARILIGLLLAWFVVLLGRAFWLQGLHKDFLRQKGDARYSRVIEMAAHRGKIVDRHGEPLAISTPVESVAASPQDVVASDAQLAELAALLKVPPAELRRKLSERKREFVYLKRQLPPELAERVVQLDVPGIFLQREYRRYYPAGDVMAHIIGFTGVDDNGQEGLELVHENDLAGVPGSRRVLKDRLGHIIEDVGAVKTPRHGRDLPLSIDLKIQYLAHRELAQAIRTHRAKAGAIVVLDAHSGEILALANQPTYNPNKRVKLDRSHTRNRAITDIFEPGSTLKPFTAAAAIEAGAYKPTTRIQTAPGKLTIGPNTIHDAHPHGILTVAEVIQKSSNVGSAKMALALDREYLWNLYRELGFGAPPQAGFPGEAAGRVRPFASWRPIEQATMSFGHGISVSLLQLARAYMVFANEGELRPLSLIHQETAPPATRVFSRETTLAVRDMLEMAVLPGGTAPAAQVAGYRVAGKTGTAHKLEGRGYAASKYVSSFVGFAPASNPRLIIAVMIDEPTAGQYYGGLVAAPVFSQVMAGSLRIIGVPPDAPTNHLVLPTDLPPVKEEV